MRKRVAFFALLAAACGGAPPPAAPPAYEPPPPAPPPEAPAPQQPAPEPEAGSVALSTAFMVGGDMPEPQRDAITAQVVQVIADGTPLFRRCYAKALASDPAIRGEVDIEMIIKPGGNIGVLRAGKGDIGDAALIDCTLRAFEQLRYPSPPSDFSIIAPMQFKPE